MKKLKSKSFNYIYDSDSIYNLEQAIEIVKKVSSVKFDETVDLAINLNVDPRHAEENIRVSTSLPKGTGKKVVLLVLAQGEKVQEALDAGADYCGNKEYLDKIKSGWVDVDKIIATPDMIQWAPNLPKTRSGKIMRRILRKIACNQEDSIGDVSTLNEPKVVEELVRGRDI